MSPMVKAIWRAAAPGRLGMVAAILALVTLARLGGAVSEGDRWAGSESQATVAVLVLWFVLPVFVLMLATVLLRGEHAPWSWGLARPISRFRLLGSIVALDAATISACILAAWIVLGGFGAPSGVFGGGLEDTAAAVAVCPYAVLYMVGAITGTHTSSTVRAAAAAVGILAVLLASLSSLGSWLAENGLGSFGSFGLQDSWADSYALYGLLAWSGPGALGEPHTWWLLSGLMLATAAIGGPTLAFVRTAQLAPGPARWSRLVAPSLGLVGVSVALLLAGWTCAYLTAPAEAKTGQITLRITPQTVEPDLTLTVTSVRLRFDGGVVPRALSHTSGAVQDRGGEVWTQTGLSAGRFEACVRGKLRARFQHCEPVVVTDEPAQTLTIHVRADEQ